jgi:hypothetical protein
MIRSRACAISALVSQEILFWVAMCLIAVQGELPTESVSVRISMPRNSHASRRILSRAPAGCNSGGLFRDGIVAEIIVVWEMAPERAARV